MAEIHSALPIRCPICGEVLMLPFTLHSVRDVVLGKEREVRTRVPDVAAHFDAHRRERPDG